MATDYYVNMQEGDILDLPVVTLAIGKGNFVCYDTADGALKIGADGTATFVYAGITIESCSATATSIRVRTDPCYVECAYTTGDAAAAIQGLQVFVDGANACDKAAGSASQVILGRVMKIISTTVVGVLTKPGNILSVVV